MASSSRSWAAIRYQGSFSDRAREIAILAEATYHEGEFE